MDTQTKPWTEMTEFEKFVSDLEGTLLARADAEDVKVVIERLQHAVNAERYETARSALQRIRNRLHNLDPARTDPALTQAIAIVDEEAIPLR